MAKAAKEDEEKAKSATKQRVRELVDEVNEAGFPKDPEDTEAYFMQELGKGEGLAADCMMSPYYYFGDCSKRTTLLTRVRYSSI